MFKDESEFKKIVDRLNIDTESNPAHRESLRQKMLCVFNETNQQSQEQTTPFGFIRRIIMKSPITKLATAAVIIIAVFISIHYLGASTPAFADIVRPLLTARTATFKMTIDMEDIPTQTVRGMFMEPGRMRQEMPQGRIMISDQQQGTMVTLMPAEKKAIVMEMENVPEEQKGKVNMFHAIRDLIQQADNESVEFLGRQKVDGVNVVGYRIEQPLMKMTIWADAKTLLPIQIEYSMGKMMGTEGTMTMSDIVFGVELDESLFEIPDGYSAQTVKYDASMPSEEDFIQSLRLWTEATGGKFPSELNMKTILGEYMKVYMEKVGFNIKKSSDMSDPKFQEFMQTYTKVTRGMTFGMAYTLDGHYAGKDVKFGDAGTPIFWYCPKGSDTYRVIYGDLNVKDVAPENLPK